jgi:hypothetical protein
MLEKEIYTRMKVGFPMLKLEFFVRHFLYIQAHKCLTWTLDYTKESDFDDSCGFWYIIPHPDDPDERTRVYYSVQVSMFDWVPKFVVDFMSSKALTDATAWVKKYSELEWTKAKKEGRAPPTSQSQPAREPVFALPFGKRKREEEERQAREEAERVALEEQAEAEKRRRLVVVRAGWRRYLLVSVVVVLAAYNVAMFFGDGQKSS